MNLSDLLTIRQAAELVPALTEGAIRMLIKRDTGGFEDECIVRIGSRVYIDRASMERWLEKRRTRQ